MGIFILLFAWCYSLRGGVTDWRTRGLRETQDKLLINLSGSTPKAACQARTETVPERAMSPVPERYMGAQRDTELVPEGSI